ncbi:MAG: SigB/SigF/SigG family RNA polymerase sigma factor [Pseudonocardiales bacterium]|nr:SigB/SigF/SigG family RNA polymerase sigma factor [Pseudonocardiales bacterium]
MSVVVDQSDPDVVVVSVIGEIDLLTASALHGHLSRLLAACPPRLVIDLSRTSFLSATALSVLINARRAAAQQATTLQLRAPTRPLPSRTLKTTGLEHLFEILPPVTDTNRSHAPHPVDDQGRPYPGEADHNDARISTSSESPIETSQDEYVRLIPLQRSYAQLTADDPQRHWLRNQLINGYLPVAEHLAHRFAGRGEPLEDLIQVATMGLINAVDRFDPDRGSHFLSFAVPTITGEIRRYFRDHSWSARVPRRLKDLTLAIRDAQAELSQHLGRAARPSEIADRLGRPTTQVIEALHAAEAYRSSSLEEMLDRGDNATTPDKFFVELDAQLHLIDDREALRPLLAQLAPRERTILALRYFHELTQNQIAEQVGVSQMHVSRLLHQTLAFLHDRMTTPMRSTPQRRYASQRTTSPIPENDQLPTSPASLSREPPP